jgi:uncharacterized membrane-anchored protein
MKRTKPYRSHATSSRSRALGALLLPLALIFPLSTSQAQEGEPVWSVGPGTFSIGDDLAEIELAEGLRFFDAENSQKVMEYFENPVSGNELAMIMPESETDFWYVLFEYDPIGYVKDDGADEIDADALMDSLQTGAVESNKERERRGWDPYNIVGWQEPPHYDPTTNNLTWAIIGESLGHRNVNRSVKLLGRRGVMSAVLVGDAEMVTAVSARVDEILSGYRFERGNTYAEFVPGKDTLAEIGLTALIAGGAGAVLAKTGLLAKFWKWIVVGVAALVAGAKKVFGKGSTATEPRAEA